MANHGDELLLQILHACNHLAPEPLYPGAFAEATRLPRPVLDEALDHLRLRGLVRLTDWVQERGQGYVLTSQGAMVLQNPALLRRRLPAAESAPRERGLTPWEHGEAVRDTLLNPTPPIVCRVLIALNVLAFLFGLVLAWWQNLSVVDYLAFATPNLQINDLRSSLGLFHPVKVLTGHEWWRLLSYAFVHLGALHLFMNMYFLYSLGPLVETMWGSLRFLYLYLVATLTGGCLIFLNMHYAGGASGALSGILTSFGVWVLLNKQYLPREIAASWQRNVLINLFLLFIISTMPGVSWEGHLGGAIGGALLAFPLNMNRFGSGGQKLLGLAGMIAVPAAAVALTLVQVAPALADRQYTIAFIRKELLAHRQVTTELLPSFAKAEKTAADTFKRFADDIQWRGDPTFSKDPKAVAAARRAFGEAHKDLETALDKLNHVGPFGIPKADDDLDQARAYLEAWAGYYKLLDQTVQKKLPWDRAAQMALDDQHRKVFETGSLLLGSRYLPVQELKLRKAPGGDDPTP